MSQAMTWNGSTRRISISDFLRSALADPDLGPASAVNVIHMVGDVPGREIYGCKLGGGTRDPDDIAKTIEQKCSFYCQDLPGVQTFNVQVFYANHGTEPKAFLPFTKTGQPAALGLMTEGPDDKGQRQQGMRHIEAMGGMYMRGNMNILEHQNHLIDRLMSHNERLTAENTDAWVMVTNTVLRQAQDNRAHEMAKLEYQRSSDERRILLGFLPAVINEAAGKELIPQGAVDSGMIDMICDAMTPEKLQALAASGALPESAVALIAMRVEKRVKQRAAQEAAAQTTREASDRSTASPDDEHGGETTH